MIPRKNCIMTPINLKLRNPATSGASRTKMKASLKATKRVPVNKACRKGLVETLTAKAADMVKDSGPAGIKKPAPKKNPKACSMNLSTLQVCFVL